MADKSNIPETDLNSFVVVGTENGNQASVINMLPESDMTADSQDNNSGNTTIKNDSQMESSGDSVDSANPEDVVNQWHCSIVVNNVDADFKSILEMALELKERGGGKIVHSIYNQDDKKACFVFEEPSVAEHFIGKGEISWMDCKMPVTRPNIDTDNCESLPYSEGMGVSVSTLGRDKLLPVTNSGTNSDFFSLEKNGDKVGDIMDKTMSATVVMTTNTDTPKGDDEVKNPCSINTLEVGEEQSVSSGSSVEVLNDEEKEELLPKGPTSCDTIVSSGDSTIADERKDDAEKTTTDEDSVNDDTNAGENDEASVKAEHSSVYGINTDENDKTTTHSDDIDKDYDKVEDINESKLILIIHDIASEMQNVVEMYLKSDKNGVGKLQSFKYNETKDCRSCI